jgi:hypothetical protein
LAFLKRTKEANKLCDKHNLLAFYLILNAAHRKAVASVVAIHVGITTNEEQAVSTCTANRTRPTVTACTHTEKRTIEVTGACNRKL